MKENHKEKTWSPLDVCEGNWKSAEEDPEEALALVLKEVDQGFVDEWTGDLDQAKEKWKDIAVGKLGVRRVEGKGPRPVMDSTAPGLNGGVSLQEKSLQPFDMGTYRTCTARTPPRHGRPSHST